MTNRPKPPLKEAARSVLSAAPSRALLRAITTNRRLSYEHRRWVYLRLGKKVRQDEATKFEHSSGTTTLKFHLQGIARELYWVGEYEPDSLPLFVEYARTAECILDVGAADGIYGLFAASVMPSTSRVLAFEPGAAQLARMRSNVALNPSITQRVTVLDVALSDHDGDEDFYELDGNSSLNPNFRSAGRGRRVSVAKGDNIVPKLAEGRSIDLMKVDTESTEPDVLTGLQLTITEHRPVIFCEVLRGRTESRLQPFVDRLAYRTWWLSPDGPIREDRIEGRLEGVNWLFLPDDRDPIRVDRG